MKIVHENPQKSFSHNFNGLILDFKILISKNALNRLPLEEKTLSTRHLFHSQTAHTTYGQNYAILFIFWTWIQPIFKNSFFIAFKNFYNSTYRQIFLGLTVCVFLIGVMNQKRIASIDRGIVFIKTVIKIESTTCKSETTIFDERM